MKYLLSLLIFSIAISAEAQTFYVERTDNGYERHIVKNLEFEGIKTSDQKIDSDYIISYHYLRTNWNNQYEGYIRLSDNNNNEIYRTTSKKKMAHVLNRFQALPLILSQLTRNELVPYLKKETTL